MEHLRPVVVAIGVAIALTGPLGTAASADCGRPGRPACTILRAPPGPTAPREAPALAPDCVLLVGGLGSHVKDPAYGSFSPLVAELPATARVEHFEYDSYGRIAPAAALLRERILALASECHDVHVVAHSMGGVVADRAFSLGLSGPDGVGTYVALASPHNGAFAARQLCGLAGIDEGYDEMLRKVSELLPVPDITSDAVCDLARVKPPRPARLVPSVRLRLVTDEVVLHTDWADRRQDARELLPETFLQLEGHGRIFENGSARAVVEASVTDGAVPPDLRTPLTRTGATLIGIGVEPILVVGHMELARTLFLGAIVARLGSLTVEAFEAIGDMLADLRHRFPPPLTWSPILSEPPFDPR